MDIPLTKYEKVEILIKDKPLTKTEYTTNRVEYTNCGVILKESFLIIVLERFDDDTSIQHITNQVYSLDNITAYKLQLKK